MVTRRVTIKREYIDCFLLGNHGHPSGYNQGLCLRAAEKRIESALHGFPKENHGFKIFDFNNPAARAVRAFWLVKILQGL